MIRLLCLCLTLALSPLTAAAQNADVSVLPGWRDAGGTHVAGLQIRLAPGWKTYWRRPGEAGIPPAFNWSGSDNVADVQVHWPVPKVFWQSGMRSVGYDKGVLLPLTVTPRVAGQPITLRLTLDMGVCQDICVPVNVTTAAVLPATATTSDPRIRAALADRAFTKSEANVSRVTCDLRLTPKGALLTATLAMPQVGQSEEVVFEPADPRLWVSEPKTARQGNTLMATAHVQAPRGQPLSLDRSGLRITVIGERGAAEIRGCSAP